MFTTFACKIHTPTVMRHDSGDHRVGGMYIIIMVLERWIAKMSLFSDARTYLNGFIYI